MSSLSNLPYGKTLDYWYEKLSGNRHRIKFIATKILEIYIFKSHSDRHSNKYDYIEFPEAKRNVIPDNPIISIVIPAYVKDEKNLTNINNLFASIERQTRKSNFVIVVDDCSPISYRHQENITFHRLDKNSGPARARNVGKEIAAQFNSHIIAFTDIDCILNDHWIEKIITNSQTGKEFNIISGNTISFDTHWLGTYHNINGTLNGRILKHSDRLLYGTTANLAITIEVAKTINFNENFPFAAGEDIEFCFRSNKQGFAIKHVPTMIVQHNFGYSKNHFNSFKKFRDLFEKYGHGEKILLKEIPEYYAYFDRTNEIPIENNGI